VDRSRLVELLRTVLAAQEDEIVCSEFFALLPRYVDLALAPLGASPSERPETVLPQVARHIRQCVECAEAYELLRELESGTR
jgi:hypothetical protein